MEQSNFKKTVKKPNLKNNNNNKNPLEKQKVKVLYKAPIKPLDRQEFWKEETPAATKKCQADTV